MASYPLTSSIDGIYSSVLNIYGFTKHFLFDIVTLFSNGKLTKWIRTGDDIESYIDKSGIDDEIKEGFMTPRITGNIAIMTRIQDTLDADGSNDNRTLSTAFRELPVVYKSFCDIMNDAACYGRFAVAAYGRSMIEAARTLNQNSSSDDTTKRFLEKVNNTTKSMIIDYCLPTIANDKDRNDCVRFMALEGGSMDILRHFVIVDKARKQVILAIRGTYSLSGILIDVQGYTMPFCDGIAHKGIADNATRLWENQETRDAITNALKENPGFDLILTGHSLGAGTACLLTIKLYHDQLLPDTNIRCFAFAPPPVYLPTCQNNIVDKAMGNIAAFIHEKDCVPFLGVDSVRRLVDTLKKLDEETSKWNVFKYVSIATGLQKAPDFMTNIVQKASEKLPAIEKGKRLTIPVPFIIWMRQSSLNNSDDSSYNAMFCRNDGEPDEGTTGVCDLGIYLDNDMVSDHMMTKYMKAIYSINSQIIHGKKGYELPPE